MSANAHAADHRRPVRRKLLVAALAIVLACGVGGWRYGRPLVDAAQSYVFLLPLVVMDLTREAATATEKSGEFKAPLNQFAVMSRYPDASFRAVPRTGLDTLFATAWADVSVEPLVLSVPDTGGRYYVIALFDMWSNVFASIGKRTAGAEAENYLIAGPGWDGSVPADIGQVYRAPTRHVWVNGQMQADGAKDLGVVTALQSQYKLTPLSKWGDAWTPKQQGSADAAATSQQPVEAIRAMTAAQFYGRAATLMADNPPTVGDARAVARLARLGIRPGDAVDLSKLDGPAVWALKTSMKLLGLLEWAATKGKTDQGWMVMPTDMARWGTDYVNRAGISLIGLGAIWPEDIQYPTAFKDGDGGALDAANAYVLHFEKGATPPSNATWSVSMYDPDGWYVPNGLDRYHLAPWMPLTFNPDGSLDIWIGAQSPGRDKESNWLPAPMSGPFNLTVRIFWPKGAALDGAYQPPGLRKAP
jgi:hypothetical protein